MILIPKYEDLYNKHPLGVSMGVGGAVRMVLRNSMGGMVQDTGWIPNTVTNYAIDTGFGQSNWYVYFHIGSDNTPPAYTDTTLGSWLALSLSYQSSSYSNLGAPSYAGRTIRTTRFNTGVGTGTIQEFGLSPSSTNTNMCIRQIIDPPIVKAADQALDVTYAFYIFWDYATKTGTVTVGSDTFDTYGHPGTLDELESTLVNFSPNATYNVHRVSDGSNMGTILTSNYDDNISSGDWSGDCNITAQGSGYEEYEVVYGLDDGNLPLGYIRTCDTRLHFGKSIGLDPRYKMRFTNQVGGLGIPKDNTQTITFTWRLHWARADAHLIPLDFDLTGVDATLTEVIP